MTAVADETAKAGSEEAKAPRTPLRERLRITQRVTQTRELLARAVAIVTGLCALVLVTGALLVALGGNDGNALVDWVKDAAGQVDFGVFNRRNGVFEFEGKNAATKNAVVNWGLAAVVWLVIGKIVSGVVRK
jgi:hypothetical protein